MKKEEDDETKKDKDFSSVPCRCYGSWFPGHCFFRKRRGLGIC